MDSYQIVVLTLLLLAVADLIVGVSNDAVNFLNSAIGSKVASRRTILIIAAAGVLLGALSSSGMMEVARKGIFNPEVFSFSDVMVIFVAVMVADIVLLDFFNTLGLPTSTTVSIVFDLLGAAVAVAVLKSLENASGMQGIAEAINTSTAFAIISGIFLSIGVAFTVGAIVQYLSRLWFSFRFERYLRSYGVVFSSISITIIVYFLLIKGAKGSMLISPEMASYISTYKLEIVGLIFIVALFVIGLLVRAFNFHPLKIVVFAGTFSLAMAFASNDLVNFIGVPLAGFQSYQIWSGSGVGTDSFMMVALGDAVKTPFIYLFLAGAIMVITLWFSGKSRKVTETEVNLGRQGDGDERFRPNVLSRLIVGGVLSFGGYLSKSLPETLIRRMNTRFYHRIAAVSEDDRPAFDLVRASVNLIMASLLIAIATSYKLPLSTTYVSFMVAMGTSLADKAWGRESAVYRVAGVLNVIGGWLITALMAFFTAGAIATAIYYGGPWVAIALGALALLFFINSNIRFNKKEKDVSAKRMAETEPEKQEALFAQLRLELVDLLNAERDVVNMAFAYISREKGKPIKLLEKSWEDFEDRAEHLKKVVYKSVLKDSFHSEEYGVALLLNQHHMEDLRTTLKDLAKLFKEHYKNHQSLPNSQYLKEVLSLQNAVLEYENLIIEKLEEEKLLNVDDLLHLKGEVQTKIQNTVQQIIIYASQEQYSHKQSVLLTEFLLHCRNIMAIKMRVVQNYQRGANAEGSIMDALS